MKSIKVLASGAAVLAMLALAGGCSGDAGPKKDGKDGKPAAKDGKGGHAHGAGPNKGGAVGDWGGGKMHFEFCVDHDKKEVTVFILGKDEKTATPIAAKDGELKANVKGVQNKDNFEVILKAKPQPKDPEGKSSCFVGTHEKIGVVQEFEGTVVGEVDGTPYTGDFKEEPEGKK